MEVSNETSYLCTVVREGGSEEGRARRKGRREKGGRVFSYALSRTLTIEYSQVLYYV